MASTAEENGLKMEANNLVVSPNSIQTKVIPPCHQILRYYDRLHLKVTDPDEPGKFKDHSKLSRKLRACRASL